MAPNSVDASHYLHGSTDQRKAFAKELVTYFQIDGFVKIRNHGIPSESIAKWFQGESFNVGPLQDTQNPNLWLSEETLPSFRQQCEATYVMFQQTADMLLEAIELGLDAPVGSLTSRVAPDPSELRLNHYPSVPKRELCGDAIRRIWPHTDFGIITLLFQDSEGGLEFEDREHPGTYTPVTSDDQADCIVNVSDILQRWTNGILKAGLHRVSVPHHLQGLETSDDVLLRDRYSIAFFQRPGEDKSAGPIQTFVTEAQPACYDEITALEHLQRRNQLVY
ncbi:MAG: hypothetical protein Q9162_000097 [Coniocarpon cinnabarinum]